MKAPSLTNQHPRVSILSPSSEKILNDLKISPRDIEISLVNKEKNCAIVSNNLLKLFLESFNFLFLETLDSFILLKVAATW